MRKSDRSPFFMDLIATSNPFISFSTGEEGYHQQRKSKKEALPSPMRMMSGSFPSKESKRTLPEASVTLTLTEGRK